MATAAIDTPLFAEIDAAVRQIEAHGYAVVPGALDADQLARMRAALDRLVSEDVANGVDLRYGPKLSNRRVRCVLNRDETFAELALHPLVQGIAKRMLGYDEVQLAALTANITGPGGDEGIGMMHADQDFLPGFYPKRMTSNAAFFLDDYTEETGATVFIPGSNANDLPAPAEMPPAETLGRMTGPAGSLAVWDGFLHHATGPNRSADRQRRGVIVTFFPPFLRGQENWCRTLDPAVLERHPGLAEITGFTEWRTMGGVWGGKWTLLNV